MVINEATEAILASRAYNYLLFQSLFGAEPTRQLLETAAGPATRESLELFRAGEGSRSSYAALLHEVETVLDTLNGCGDAAIEDLLSEYTRLFLGPLELKAPPWESIYVSKKHQLFDENTLGVRNFYRSQGFLPAEYPRVADDSLALECAFMSQLGKRAQEAYSVGVEAIEEGEESESGAEVVSESETNATADTVITALDASRRFLDEHLLVWLPDYLKALAAIERAGFYLLIARLAWEYLREDRRLLDELIAELESSRSTNDHG